MLFWYFYIKKEPGTGRPGGQNVDETTEIMEFDRHVKNHSIAKEIKIIKQFQTY